MKKRLLQSVLLLFLFPLLGLAQSVGDYQSFQSGNWNDVNTWSSWDGSAWTSPVSAVPSGTGHIVTILATHVVTITTSNVSIDSLFISGQLIVNSGDTLTVPTPVGTEEGIVVNSGGTVTINGVFNYARNGGNGSGIPTATWGTGSTCLISGPTSTAPSNANQNFFNIVWDCPAQTTSLNLAWSGITIGGSVTCNNTNGSQFRWTNNNANSGSPITITINGDVIVNNAALMSVTSSGSPLVYTINQSGSISINGTGQLYVCGTSNTGAYVTWNVTGDISAVSGTELRSSNTISRWTFNSGSTQDVNIGATNVVTSGVIFEVANGSTVQLNSSFNIGRLVLTSGKIISTSTNQLTITSTNSLSGGSSTAYVEGPMSHQYNIVGAATFSYPIAKDGIYRPVTLSLTQSSTTTSTYTAEVFNSTPPANTLPGTLDKVSSVRYYKITESGGGSAFTAGGITLSYDADDGVNDATNLRVAEDDGSGNWADLGGTGSASPTGTISSTSTFTTVGDFVLANNNGGSNPLPIELSSFAVSPNKNGIELQWATATEADNYGFEIERKQVSGFTVQISSSHSMTQSEATWASVGFVDASGTSNSPKQYSYTDNTVTSGIYSYRLKQINRDGSFTYSKEIQINAGDVPKVFSLAQNYPNPFNPSTKIEFTVGENGRATLRVYNTIGQMVGTLFDGVAESGTLYQATFDASHLASGMYFSVLQAGKQRIVKKMLLTK
jgi:Secretion system C-terminal sorting domain